MNLNLNDSTFSSGCIRLLSPIAAVLLLLTVCAFEAAGQTDGSKNVTSPAAAITPVDRQSDTGREAFAARCGFCHGRDAMGGETGPDLTRSTIVKTDDNGNGIRAVVRSGRPEKGMPRFDISDEELSAIVDFVRRQAANSVRGKRRTVEPSDFSTGDRTRGQRLFEGALGCSKCHSPTGDLGGIKQHFEGLLLLRRILNPADVGTGVPGAKTDTKSFASVKVTLSSGKTIEGTLAYLDEFNISLFDAQGVYHSFETGSIRYELNDPLKAHIDLLGKYSDDDLHDLMAYLKTL